MSDLETSPVPRAKSGAKASKAPNVGAKAVARKPPKRSKKAEEAAKLKAEIEAAERAKNADMRKRYLKRALETCVEAIRVRESLGVDEAKVEVTNVFAKLGKTATNVEVFHALTSLEAGDAFVREIDAAMEDKRRRETLLDVFTCTRFTCPKCFQKKSSYVEMQKRSSDEPMSLYLTCGVCKSNWTIR